MGQETAQVFASIAIVTIIWLRIKKLRPHLLGDILCFGVVSFCLIMMDLTAAELNVGYSFVITIIVRICAKVYDLGRKDSSDAGTKTKASQTKQVTAEKPKTQEKQTAAEKGKTQEKQAAAEKGKTQEKQTAAEKGKTQEKQTAAEKGKTQEKQAAAEKGKTQEKQTTAEKGKTQEEKKTSAKTQEKKTSSKSQEKTSEKSQTKQTLKECLRCRKALQGAKCKHCGFDYTAESVYMLCLVPPQKLQIQLDEET